MLTRPKLHLPAQTRALAQAAAEIVHKSVAGDISDAFASLSGRSVALPSRFVELKKQLWRDRMLQSWGEVLDELKAATKEIAAIGPSIIPRVPFEQIKNGQIDPELLKRVKQVGTIIVEGAIPEEEALRWKADLLEYARINKPHVRGFPPENIQVFEFYNTVSQTAARTHPNAIVTQKWLLSSLLHASDPKSKISLETPISYYDRLRIRLPGDSRFALGAHIDGGSLERWEDPGYRSCFASILDPPPSSSWHDHDSYDVSPRINAITDLYKTGTGQCSVYRPWQGWTSLSHTGPNEGTLRVFPRVHLSTAYLMLRPFFSPKEGKNPREDLSADDWEVDLESTDFPGSQPGKGQDLNEDTHPHLKLGETMTSVPKIRPGDQVFWFCDVIHAVESTHHGKSDSSVMYIPAVPLTLQNATHLRLQASHFAQGLPSPDFPQGQGESLNLGRSSADSDDVKVLPVEARRMLGLEKFEIPKGATEGVKALVEEVNAKMA